MAITIRRSSGKYSAAKRVTSVSCQVAIKCIDCACVHGQHVCAAWTLAVHRSGPTTLPCMKPVTEQVLSHQIGESANWRILILGCRVVALPVRVPALCAVYHEAKTTVNIRSSGFGASRTSRQDRSRSRAFQRPICTASPKRGCLPCPARARMMLRRVGKERFIFAAIILSPSTQPSQPASPAHESTAFRRLGIFHHLDRMLAYAPDCSILHNPGWNGWARLCMLTYMAARFW